MHSILRSSLCGLLTLTGSLGTLVAQDFSYPPYRWADLQTNGYASSTPSLNELELNPAYQGVRGSAFQRTPASVYGGFYTRFTFRITPAGPGGDGMTFVIHNDPGGVLALGGSGRALGVGGMRNALSIDLRNYNGGRPDWHGIGVATGGTGSLSAYTSYLGPGLVQATTDYADGMIHMLEISYVPGTVKVWLDGTLEIEVAYSLETGGTLAGGSSVGGLSLIDGHKAYIGFTASTGAVRETHDVFTWDFWSEGRPRGSYQLTDTLSTITIPVQLSATGGFQSTQRTASFDLPQWNPLWGRLTSVHVHHASTVRSFVHVNNRDHSGGTVNRARLICDVSVDVPGSGALTAAATAEMTNFIVPLGQSTRALPDVSLQSSTLTFTGARMSAFIGTGTMSLPLTMTFGKPCSFSNVSAGS